MTRKLKRDQMPKDKPKRTPRLTMRTEPMFFIQVSSVQMISSSWGCPYHGTSRSMYESHNTSGAGCNSIGQKIKEDA